MNPMYGSPIDDRRATGQSRGEQFLILLTPTLGVNGHDKLDVRPSNASVPPSDRSAPSAPSAHVTR